MKLNLEVDLNKAYDLESLARKVDCDKDNSIMTIVYEDNDFFNNNTKKLFFVRDPKFVLDIIKTNFPAYILSNFLNDDTNKDFPDIEIDHTAVDLTDSKFVIEVNKSETCLLLQLTYEDEDASHRQFNKINIKNINSSMIKKIKNIVEEVYPNIGYCGPSI
jgi:hypothetical protein